MFADGSYFQAANGEFMSVQMCVEYKIPQGRTREWPIVMMTPV